MEQLRNDKEFSKFRADLGEREIENYLYNKRSNPNPNRVTILISEDQGSKYNIQKYYIQRLRQSSQNTIILLSSYGFATALKELGIIKNEIEVFNADSEAFAKFRETKVNRILEENNTAFVEHIDPQAELKFAKKMVELVELGWFS